MDYVMLICCLLAFVLYYNTLEAEFVYDDRRAILNNPDLLPKTPWSQLFQNDFWGTPLVDSGSHGSYRPLSVLTFRLNYLFGGFQPWGYHLVNIFLHCLATFLLVKVARLVLPRSKSRVGSMVTGLLFAAHPVHTETVAGVVGRADLAACNLFFMSFLAYVAHVKYRDTYFYSTHRSSNSKIANGMITSNFPSTKTDTRKYQKIVYSLQKNVTSCSNWTKKMLAEDREKELSSCMNSVVNLKVFNWCCWKYTFKNWIYLILSILLAVAAMLSKETGITVLGLCFVYDYVCVRARRKKQNRSIVILCLSLSLILLVRLQTTRIPQFSTADNPTAREHSFLTRVLTFFYLPVFNFWILVLPSALSFDWGMDAIPRITTFSDRRNLVTLTFYFFLIKVLIRCVHVVNRSLNKRNLSLVKEYLYSSAVQQQSFCTVCHHTNCSLEYSHSLNCRNTNNNNNNSTTNASCGCISKKCTEPTIKTPTVHAAVLISLAFLILPFLPAANILFYVGFVVAERVLYIPSAGLCLLVGLSSGALWNRHRRYRGLFTATFFAVIVTFSVKTVLRNRDWRNEEALYRSAIPVNPPKAYGNLGSVLSSQGRVSEAEWAFRKALQHRPNMADVHYNLGILLQGKQQLDEAILSYQRAIHFRPSLALAYVNLGTALIAAGRCQEAVTILRQGSRLDGTGLKDRREHESAKVSALLQLGALYSDQGRLQRALAAYREAAYSLPEHYPPQSVFNVLGETLARLQQDEEAERWYRAALDAQPDHVPAHITYGKLLAKNISRAAEAEQWFRKAQKLAPGDPSVYHYYGEFLASRRRYKEASAMYEKAAELRPEDYELTVAAATAMRQALRHEDAEKWYRIAVALKPSDARSHTNLGAILHLNGKYREAAESYREALRLQPNDVTTLTNLHKLRSVMT